MAARLRALGQRLRQRLARSGDLVERQVRLSQQQISSILGYYGRYVPLEELRQVCGVSRDGSKASHIIKAARWYGLLARGLRHEPAGLRALSFPLMVFWNFNHFLVVEGFGKTQVYLNDPASGPRVVSTAEFDQAFTGVVLTFEPGPEFQRGGAKPSALRGLRERLRGSAGALAYVALTGLALVVPGLLLPTFGRVFVDYYLVQGLTHWLPWLLVGVAVTGLLLISLAIAALNLLGLNYISRKRADAHQQSLNQGGKLMAAALSGLQIIAFARWASAFGGQRALAFQARHTTNTLAVFNAVYPTATTLAIFALAAWSAGRGAAMSTGDFLAFSAAFGQFPWTSLAICATLLAAFPVIPLYERARPILQTLPEVTPLQTDPGELRGAIEISHVSFRYREDEPPVLQDLSLRARPGEFVALVGPSGCGKSTLLRLLLGFERPLAGAIYYDGQDLWGLDVERVRRQIGVVLQHDQLIAGNILSNIIGSLPLSLEDAWEAARLVGLDADINEMPMGMHTLVGEGTSTLSGGQRQRLLIACAIVNKPRILLFDEATSALDNRAQAQVSASLEQLQATRIVIAHRLSTIVNADQIFVLDGGRVAQICALNRLLRTDSH